MKKLLLLLIILPVGLYAQRYKEQLTFSSAGDIEMPLGRYQIGATIRIECQIDGGWAQDGGIYHISGDWYAVPKVIYRGESSIGNRLKFYGYIDPTNKGQAFLFATWDNMSPNESYANGVKFTIYSEGLIDTNNKGSFGSAVELQNILVAQSTTGNVGIGTTSPEKKLEVNGDILLRNSTGIKQIFTWNHNDGNWRIGMNQNPGFNRSITTSHVQYLTYATGPGQGFSVGVNGGNSSFEIRGVDHAAFFRGNVGIGNTNPTEKLVVDGKIMAEEILVENVPSSDFVFEPDYDLKPIEEVEAFIKENKHLPDIPSAAEFKENGVGLGEMDDMLLRKVEELTLYVIQMQKQVDQLKEENIDLKNEIENIKTDK